MELRHIRYFLAVAQERHFTRAAAKVGIGQPPLSQQIKDLEGEVGAALFHRLAHGAELTEAGKAFLAGVKEMPLIAQRATMAARRAARGELGSLRLGFTSTATFNVVVPSAIRSFRRAYPEIYLTLEEANTTRLVTGLREGTLDAVFLRPGTPDTGELQLRRLSEEPMVVALPKRHSAAGLEEIDSRIVEGRSVSAVPAGSRSDGLRHGCRRLSKGRLRAYCRPGRAAFYIDRESRGRRARRIDRPGVDDASARDGHRLSADCWPVADDAACSRLSARRDVARGAQFHRAGRLVMLLRPGAISSTTVLYREHLCPSGATVGLSLAHARSRWGRQETEVSARQRIQMRACRRSARR